jgi:hypothetical protein
MDLPQLEELVLDDYDAVREVSYLTTFLHSLSKLEYLEVRSAQVLQPNALERLQVHSLALSGIIDVDLNVLRRMPKLVQLHLRDWLTEPNILSRLTTVTNLTLSNMNPDFRFSVLYPMQQLKELRIQGTYPAERIKLELRKLRKALPYTKITMGNGQN